MNFITQLFKFILSIVQGTPKEPEGKLFDVDLIKRWEGLRLKAYQDGGGVWTIGFGHTKTVTPTMKITAAQAEELLLQDIAWASEAVEQLVTVPLNFDQRSVLISFVYNIGRTQFSTSTLLRVLNKGAYEKAGQQLLRWVHDNGQFVQGLRNRREDELRRFISNEGTT
mgnify:CR=1 FL=1